MSNPITEARADVAEALRGIEGLQVFDYLPERLSPPTAVVIPDLGGTYVQPGQVLGELQVSLTVRLYCKRAVNEVATKALDELIVNVVEALQEFGLPTVATPQWDGDYVDQGTYLVSNIAITTTYKGGN